MSVRYIAIGTGFLMLAVWVALVAIQNSQYGSLFYGISAAFAIVGAYAILDELYTRSLIKSRELREDDQ